MINQNTAPIIPCKRKTFKNCTYFFVIIFILSDPILFKYQICIFRQRKNMQIIKT